MSSRYINTDVDIKSPNDLSELAELLDEKCDLLFIQSEEDGSWFVCVEASGSGIIGTEEHNATRDIIELLKVFEDLEEKYIHLLRKAKMLDFNIGWQSSEERPEGSFTIASDILRRISNLGATLTVTIYPSSENNADDDF